MRQNRSKGQRAVDKALSAFEHSEGSLHRGIRESLRTLKAADDRVEARFDDRRHQRRAADAASSEAAVESARASLAELEALRAHFKALAKKNRDPGMVTILETADNQVRSGKLIIAAAKRAAAPPSSKAVDDFEQSLRAWHDRLVVKAVSAIWDSKAPAVIAAGFSGSLVVAGVLTGPAGAIAAAAGSAAVIGGELARRLNKAKRVASGGAEEARLERARITIHTVAEISESWATIL